MTNPETTQVPNPNPPHQTNPDPPPQQPRPVIVQQQQDNSLTERVNEMARTLAGLPEQLVNSVRESMQPHITQPTQPATGEPTTPVTPATPPTTVEEQSKHGPQISRFAKWFKGIK